MQNGSSIYSAWVASCTFTKAEGENPDRLINLFETALKNES